MVSIYKSAAGQKKVMDLYDATLSQWPVPYDTFVVPTRYGDTFIIASGSAASPPLVLLHGTASNSLTWINDIAEYSRYFRVYAADLPGEPGKSAPNPPSFDNSANVEWMEDWLNHLKIKQAALLGISLGAWIVTRFAICKPERVLNLVILAPVGIVTGRRSFLLRAILCYLMRPLNKKIANYLNYGDQQIHPDTLHFMDVISDHFKPRFINPPIFSAKELQRLKMPVLLIAGAKDTVFPSEKSAGRFKKLVPQAQIKILTEEGHVLCHMSPLVVPFLASGSPAIQQYNQSP